jgi:hypothetical protein
MSSTFYFCFLTPTPSSLPYANGMTITTVCRAIRELPETFANLIERESMEAVKGYKTAVLVFVFCNLFPPPPFHEVLAGILSLPPIQFVLKCAKVI